MGVAFTVSFLCYFQNLQLLVVKKIWTNFCCIVLLHLWAQKECLRFLKSYFKLEILIFLSFLASTKNLLFWRKEHQQEVWEHFSREANENYCGKVLKENSIIGRSWSSAELFIVQNYTENVTRYVPLTGIWNCRVMHYNVIKPSYVKLWRHS